MTISIYSYDGQKKDCIIPYPDNVQKIIINLDIGDETLLVFYNNGRRRLFHSGTFHSGLNSYELYNSKTGFSLLNNSQWLSSTNPHERADIANKFIQQINNNI